MKRQNPLATSALVLFLGVAPATAQVGTSNGEGRSYAGDVKGTRYAPLDQITADAGTGELLWMHRLDEGARGEAFPRCRSGCGLAYWDDDGAGRVLYVTPGYRLIALDAATVRPGELIAFRLPE